MIASFKWRLAAALAAGIGCGPALAEPSNADLQRQIEELQQQIEALAKDAEAEQKADGAARTKVGGYGEMHYNNLNGEGGAADKAEIDFHRFVLYIGHDYNERVRFRSELELEHALAGEGKPGEVELEQAFVEFDVSDSLTARGGLFLVPVGILNETHEPPTFYGVERNPVEGNIIPTTWWAGGAGMNWRFGAGWALDWSIHEGLNTTAASNYAVRSGRQKTAGAKAEDLASTLRLKWTGVPGLELAATYHHQQDVTQSADATAGGADLIEAHAIVQRGPFGFRALYASWNLDGAGPSNVGADQQQGFYLEPSLKLGEHWGVFARYNQWDNQAGSGDILLDSGETEKAQTNIGFNYWPVQNVVIKADYQAQDNDDDSNQDGINLGIGYQF